MADEQDDKIYGPIFSYLFIRLWKEKRTNKTKRHHGRASFEPNNSHPEIYDGYTCTVCRMNVACRLISRYIIRSSDFCKLLDVDKVVESDFKYSVSVLN